MSEKLTRPAVYHGTAFEIIWNGTIDAAEGGLLTSPLARSSCKALMLAPEADVDQAGAGLTIAGEPWPPKSKSRPYTARS